MIARSRHGTFFIGLIASDPAMLPWYFAPYITSRNRRLGLRDCPIRRACLALTWRNRKILIRCSVVVVAVVVGVDDIFNHLQPLKNEVQWRDIRQ